MRQHRILFLILAVLGVKTPAITAQKVDRLDIVQRGGVDICHDGIRSEVGGDDAFGWFDRYGVVQFEG